MSQHDLPPAAEAAHLTVTLREALDGAQVQQVSVVSDRTIILSRILRLRLTCDRPADAAPDTVILQSKACGTAYAQLCAGPQLEEA